MSRSGAAALPATSGLWPRCHAGDCAAGTQLEYVVPIMWCRSDARCTDLTPGSAGRPIDIRDTLIARIAEAERQGRLGEFEGLQVGLAGARNGLAQIDRHAYQRTTAGLGRPVT